MSSNALQPMKLVTKDNLFVFNCGFDDRYIPKDAGFRWNREEKFWWTDNETKAAALANYADEETAKRLNHLIEVKKEVIQESQADDADIEIPCNQGMEYLPYQRAGIAYAAKRDSVLLADEMGLGKQQPVDTKVLTITGWAEIGSLKVGDLIVGSYGKPIKVTGIFPQGVKPSYRIKFSDHSSVEAGPEHLWTVAYMCGGKRWQEMVLTTDELRLRPYKGKLDLAKTTFYLPMLSGPAYFKNDNPTFDPYTLGALIANGSMLHTSATLSFHIDDKDHILSRVSSIRKVNIYGKCVRGTVVDAIGPMRDFGLNVYSGEKFIPRQCLHASPSYRLALLQGLMDGDGYVTRTRCKVSYHTTSIQLAQDIQELCEGLGGIASIRHYDRSDEGKGIEYQVRIRMPKWAPPFSSPRKLARWNPGKNARPCRTVVSVEYVRDVESVCISVDAEDKLYVTEHCILTHNTVQAIGVSNIDPNAKNILIICPASLKLNWQREFRKWDTKKLSVGVVMGDEFPRANVVIINYDILKKYEYALRAKEWDILIADECHYIKNGRALRTIQIVGKKDKKDATKNIEPIPAKKKVFLTGTPILNKPAELWTIANFLAPKVFNSWFTFMKRYAGMYQDRFGYNTNGATNLEELQIKLRESIMVRRLKEDVLKELPAKRRQVIEFDATGIKAVEQEQLQWSKHKENIEALKMAVELAKAESDETYEAAVKKLREGMTVAFTDMARVRHETALAKVPFVIEHVEDSLENGKVILFAHHKDVIAKFVEHFKGKCVYVTGDVSIEDRQRAVDQFQTNTDVTLFIGNIKAAGVGLTLTASSHVIFAELDWVPGNMTQCEDRAHRIGQVNSVLCQHLVLAGSLDATIATTLIEKQEIIEKALDNPEIIIPEADPIKPATASMSREKIEKEAVSISPEEIEDIHRKLKFLSAMCDGAHSVDGMGFNKMDTGIGHSLARAGKLTSKQAVLGRKLVTKYRRQLSDTSQIKV